MKKIFLILLAIVLTMTMTACANSSNTTAPQNSQTQGEASKKPSTPPSPKPSNKQKESEPNIIYGTLYVVFGEDDTQEFDFGYEEGKLTPERIAEALTALTGLQFSISSEFRQATNTFVINWHSDSTLATGVPPEPQKVGFEFFDDQSLRWFMLDSLCRSVRENYGDADVFYDIEGMELNDIMLDTDFNPAIPFNRMDKPSSTTAPQNPQTQGKTSQKPSTPPSPKPSNKQKESEPNMINGTLYAVFGPGSTQEFDFGYEEGKLTPERIADALTGLTGLQFSISSEFDSSRNTLVINWHSDSSLATGLSPEPQNEGFEFFDAQSLRWFMLNSLCRSIRENYGKVDVYYGIEGMELNDIMLDIDFNPAIPFNRMEDNRVLG